MNTSHKRFGQSGFWSGLQYNYMLLLLFFVKSESIVKFDIIVERS